MNKISLGLIDFGSDNHNTKKLVEKLLEYAVKGDELGYSRFWLGEHYLTYGSIWYNPEILVPIIAGMTDNMKIGVAGLLMAFHNPYRVALNFKLLSNLFPGRIDLGFARGSVPEKIAPLFFSKAQLPPTQNLFDIFNQNVDDVIQYLRYEHVPEDIWPIVPPPNGEIPQLWALSTSSRNILKIIPQRLNYSRSIFHFKMEDISQERDIILEYKETFYKAHGVYPQINVAFCGICHSSSQKAKQIFESTKSSFITQNELIGDSNQFHDTLSLYQELFGVNEFIFLNLAQETEDKFLGIELLSSAFKLK